MSESYMSEESLSERKMLATQMLWCKHCRDIVEFKERGGLARPESSRRYADARGHRRMISMSASAQSAAGRGPWGSRPKVYQKKITGE